MLALLLTAATYVCLLPGEMSSRQVVFVPPSSGDLILPARSTTNHLSRSYQRSVINRVAEIAPLFCGERSALFAQNFVMRGSAEADEVVVDAQLVHFCSRTDSQEGGETMLGLKFNPLGTSKVVCAEEYAGRNFVERQRPSMGMLEYWVVEDGNYRIVRRAARSASEACLAQHSIEILSATWQNGGDASI